MSDPQDTWDRRDAWDRLWAGGWLTPLPERLREPAAWGLLLGAVALVALAAFAPWADARGTAYLQASFARTLAALCRRHGLVAQAESLEAQADRLEAEALALGKGLN
jgi:hypothetical protein